MDKESILKHIEGWGYRALSKPHADSPGYSRLLVAIRKKPTGEHFDSERLRLRLRDSQGDVRWGVASWRMPVKEADRVCPGPVILYDRYDKQVEFFTFGSSLEVILEPDILVYGFESRAPILELTASEETISDQLAYEAEALMAELEERWEEEHGAGFEQRLTEIDPLSLYVPILNAILLRYSDAHALRRAYRRFYEALKRERDWLNTQDIWPKQPLRPEDLLLKSP